MKETWKPVVGWESLYEISTHGRLRSLITKLVRKLQTDKDGYQTTHLHFKGNRSFVYVHRLILEAFVGPCPLDQQACHNDGNSAHNQLNNLRWDTCSQNNLDKRKHGTAQIGERSGASRFFNEQVQTVRWLYEITDLNQIQLACMLGTYQAVISNIIRYKTWSHLSSPTRPLCEIFYLAGPIRNTPNNNYDGFMNAARGLRQSRKCLVFNPIEYDIEFWRLTKNSAYPEGLTLRRILAHDILVIAECDGVAVLPDWEQSLGTNFEKHATEVFGQPFIPVENLLKAPICPV